MPIDLTFWRIKPRRAPDWWPKLTDYESSTLVQFELEKPIETLLEKSDDAFLMFAEGAISPSKGWKDEDPSCSFSLTGFAYKVVGPDIPAAEELAKILINRPPSFTLIPSMAEFPFNFIDNYPNLYPLSTETKQIKDLIISPLIVRIRDITISLWQFFQELSIFFLWYYRI